MVSAVRLLANSFPISGADCEAVVVGSAPFSSALCSAVKLRPSFHCALIWLAQLAGLVAGNLPTNSTALAIKIPAAIKQRLRLNGERSWIVLTESNRFGWPGPDLRPLETESGYCGVLPPALFSAVKRGFVALAKSQAHQGTRMA